MALWNVGGGIKHYKHLVAMNDNAKQLYDTPHNFFNSVFDSTFGLRWNGGRICHPHDSVTIEDFMHIIMSYNEQGIGFNFTFSNRLLTEEDMKDEYCNLLCEAAASSGSKKQNGVITASPILRNYIRKTYPELKIIWSVCNGINKLDAYNTETNNPLNDIVVLHPDYNHDYKFLQQLENKDRLEVMVNDLCAFGCPYRAKHYDQLSQFALLQSTNPIIHRAIELDMGRPQDCEAVAHGMVKDGRNKLSFSDLDLMEDMGFVHFNLIGREHDWDYYYKTDLFPNLEQRWIQNIIKTQNLNHHI